MNKNLKYRVIIFASLIVLAFVIERVYFKYVPIIYPNFGINIPAGYTTHGIDVSRYQKDIDWKLVSEMVDQGQKISFVIIKATEGTDLTDKYFKCNWEKVDDFPLLRGAYLYFHPNKSGKEQAKYFISKVKLKSGDLPPVVDIEETNRVSNEKLRTNLKECLDELQKEYNRKPIIYTNVDFYEKRIGEDFDQYPLWAAHYEQFNAPRIKRDWLIWQHNCKGHVNGIKSEVDFNVVNGSITALEDLCI